MSLSRESLELFSHLLAQVNIQGVADDAAEQVAKIQKARREITEAWAASEPESLVPESNPGDE